MVWLLLCAVLVTASAASECWILRKNDTSFPSQDVTLKLVKRDWPTHQLVTEVAAILLGEALNYDVKIVEPEDVTPNEDPQAIAEGRFDANFEFWPQGKEAELKNWTAPGQARVAGGHEVLSHSGVYTMKYTVEKWPEAAFYQHLLKPRSYKNGVKGEAAADPEHLCATPEWNCTNFTWLPPMCRSNASACWGQVLHSRTTYTQGQIEQQIANNGLGLEVTYLTPDSLATEVWEAYAARQNLLFYASKPSEGFFDITDDQFVPVRFPPLGSRCNGAYTALPTGNFSCQIPGRPLLKVVSPALQASPDAARFAAVFSLQEADFQALLNAWRLYDGDARAAACAWLHRIGSTRWGGWISFSKKIYVLDGGIPTQGCFPYAYVLLGVAIITFAALRILKALMHRRQERSRAAQSEETQDTRHSSDLERLQFKMHNRACKTHADLSSRFVNVKQKELVAVKFAVLSGKMNFMSFFRCEEDFCRPLGQAMGPPDASSALRQFYHTKLETLVYVCTSGFTKTLMSAVSYAAVAGAVGALLSQVRRVAEMNKRVDPWMLAQEPYLQFLSSMETVHTVIDGFDFLPVFLITYMIGQDVNRWHEWLQKMLIVQGRIHDLILILNSSYRKVNEPVVGEKQRKALFKWYRYMNSIHYLNYLNLVPGIGNAPTALTDLETVGLLSTAECERLRFSSVKARDTLTSWLGRYWQEELEAGNVQNDHTFVFMQQLCQLRAILAGLNDMPCKAPPQIVRMMMVIVTNALLVLALLGYPAKMYKQTDECIQFWPLLACFLYCVCYRGMLHVMFTLDKGPFYAKGECVNVDALLISTERFCYHVFRNPFEQICERSACSRSPTEKYRGISLSPKAKVM